MFVKEIINNIEPGTLIKGLRIEPFVGTINIAHGVSSNNAPRIATLSVDGWDYPVPSFECAVIRTLFYLDSGKPSWVKSYSAAELKEKTITKSIIKDPWSDWRGYNFIEFKKDLPIGVHLGEFIICRVGGSADRKFVNLYTKILLVDGTVGFLVFETEDRMRRRAELI